MKIKKLQGTITAISILSETAKEVTVALSEPLGFSAGSFVNVFMNIDGENIRRAYSISSSDKDQQTITLSVRLSPSGKMTPLFWNTNLIGHTLELMGPMGLNTVEKMNRTKTYLFAFGIGIGVVKSIVDHLSQRENITSIIIMIGSRNKDDILYKAYFDELTSMNPSITSSYIVANQQEESPYKKGYIQHHIEGLDFNHADIYVCGQEIACTELVTEIQKTKPTDCDFFIEDFH